MNESLHPGTRAAIAAPGAADRFEVLVRTSSDVVMVLDLSMRVEYCSPAAENVLRQPIEALTGEVLTDCLRCIDAKVVHESFARAFANPGESQTLEWAVRVPRGPKRRLESTLVYLPHEPSVRGYVMNTRDVTERRKLEEELEHQAFHDALTGLPNRSLFKDRLHHALDQSGRNEQRLSVLYCDLDGFKNVNDTLGHAYGDVLLLIATERLRSTLRVGDTVARLGGDEFAVMLENATDNEVETIAGRIVQLMEQPFDLIGGQEAVVGVSMGIVDVEPGSKETVDNILRNADLAMYVAKSLGRGRHVRFEPSMHDRAAEEAALKNDLRRALNEGELAVHYQPILDLATHRIISLEALVRWPHAERGMVPPVAFIPLAEETGMIIPLGEFVLRTACSQLARWQAEMPDSAPRSVSVNLSSRQLQEKDIVETIIGVLNENGLAPGCLTVEVTESVLLEHVETVVPRLQRLHDFGVRIAIDDFGTGYSSLSYLNQFPVDVLKIDRSFVSGIGTDQQNGALIRAIVAMGQTMALTTVAEGIEMPEELQELRQLGCDMGQGYFFARPADAETISKSFLRSSDGTRTV